MSRPVRRPLVPPLSACCSWPGSPDRSLAGPTGRMAGMATEPTTGSSTRPCGSSMTHRRRGSRRTPHSSRPTTPTRSSTRRTSTCSTRRATGGALSTGSRRSTTRRSPRTRPATTTPRRSHSAGWPTTTATSSSRSTRNAAGHRPRCLAQPATSTSSTTGRRCRTSRRLDDHRPDAGMPSLSRSAPNGDRRGRLLARLLPGAVHGVPRRRDAASTRRVDQITGASLLRRASSDLANLLAFDRPGRRRSSRRRPMTRQGSLHRTSPSTRRRPSRDGQGRGRSRARRRPRRHRLPEAGTGGGPSASTRGGESRRRQ